VYSGPLERARETADVLAAPSGHRTRVVAGLDELDFGAWTGRTLTSLADDPLWHAFNQERDRTRPPGGELMAEAAERAMAELDGMRTAHPEATVIAVSHADVIRGVLLRCLGLPMGAVHRLEVSPASVSVVRLWPNGSQVAAVNWLPGHLPR
jgi:probable phosphoglycerate mutase